MSNPDPEMAKHIDEDILERYVLGDDRIGGEVVHAIERHVTICHLCAEKVEKFRAFYADVREHLNEPPTEREATLAASLTSPGVPSLPVRGVERKKTDERVIETYAQVLAPGRPALPRLIYRFMRRNPVKSVGGLLLLSAAMMYAVTMVSFQKDRNPVFAEIKDYVLYAYNKESELLWKKGVPGQPDWRSDTPAGREGPDPRRRLLIINTKTDGLNDVLLTGATYEGEFTKDTLFCFDANGEFRWKCGIALMESFGRVAERHHSRGAIVDFTSFRKTPTADPQLFVLASEETFSPSKLFEVNTVDGTIRQSFYNRGGCSVLRHLDIDGDGTQELLVGGVNDGFNRACVAVLDPSRINGYAPVPPEFKPTDLGEAKLKYYLLFPLFPLPADTRNTDYGSVIDFLVAPGHGVQVVVWEGHFDPDAGHAQMCSMFFSMDSTLAIDGVTPDEEVTHLAERYRTEGRIRAPLGRPTIEALKDSVRYWDGDQFVRNATRNRYFNEAVGTGREYAP